jgi:nicotinate (nicotinamide) nucleotide adenylyltransferase
MIYIFGWAFDPPHVGHAAIVKSLLAKKHPKKIVLIPSSERDDKKYSAADLYRLAMLDIFVWEIDDERVIIDDYFIRNWKGEMITKDVDLYAKEKYGEDIIHLFGTDTIESMPSWDNEWYAAKKIEKLFAPRKSFEYSVKEIHSFGIENFEYFSTSHIPDISSTDLRKIIPDHTGLKSYYEEEPKFIIPGLSKRISQYILENRLYRPKLEKKPKVLVHVCCGPDVTMPILALRDEYDVICFWYDPNIQPKEEHDKRYDAFVKVCEIEGIPYIKWAYDVKNFFTRIKWLEFTPEKWEKCTNCYDMRMYVAAKLAKKLKIPFYTSSLNTSPKKDLEKLFTMGHKYAEKYGITFLDIPFRKKWGFEKSVEYTREHDIFRQNYCGCIYSIREGGESEMKQKFVW